MYPPLLSHDTCVVKWNASTNITVLLFVDVYKFETYPWYRNGFEMHGLYTLWLEF